MWLFTHPCVFVLVFVFLLQASNLQSTPATTSGGVGGGDRIFPPTGGLTFTTWVLVNRFSVDEPGPHLSLLSLSHTVSSKNQKVGLESQLVKGFLVWVVGSSVSW